MSPSWLRGASLLSAAALLPLAALTPSAQAAPTPSTIPPVEHRVENLDDFSAHPAYAQWYSQTLTWAAEKCPQARTAALNTLRQQSPPDLPHVTGIECAQVKAPKDWHDPAKGTIDVGISRILFSDSPAHPARLMLSNPGGPGVGSLINEAAGTAMLRKTTATHLNVGIDVRGLGTSTNVTCPMPSARPKDAAKDARNVSPEFIRADMDYMNQHLHACLQQPDSLLPYINSEQTARDVNLVRHVLGYPTADMEGSSYGTWLGSVLGRMFPRSFDRLILDGTMDFATGTFLTTFTYQPESRQAALDRTLLPWLARRHDIFRLGDTPAAVNENLEALRSALGRRELAPNWHPDLLDVIQVQALDTVFAVKPMGSMLSALYGKWKHGTPIPPEMVEQLDGMASDEESFPPGIVFNEMVQYAVSCNDSGSFGDVDHAVRTVLKARAQYPLTGAYHGVVMCSGWPQKAALTPELLERPLYALMVQTENDGRTMYTGAHHSRFATPGHLRMVLVDDQLGHGVQTSACAGGVVRDYLGKGVYPASDVHCQARPLPDDTKVYEFMNPASSAQPLSEPFRYLERDLTEPPVDDAASATPRHEPSTSERATEELVRTLLDTGRRRR